MAHEWNSILLLDFSISNYYSGKVDWFVKKASTKINYYILKVLRHVKKMSVKISFKKQTMNSYELRLGKQQHALSSARQGYNGKH